MFSIQRPKWRCAARVFQFLSYLYIFSKLFFIPLKPINLSRLFCQWIMAGAFLVSLTLSTKYSLFHLWCEYVIIIKLVIIFELPSFPHWFRRMSYNIIKNMVTRIELTCQSYFFPKLWKGIEKIEQKMLPIQRLLLQSCWKKLHSDNYFRCYKPLSPIHMYEHFFTRAYDENHVHSFSSLRWNFTYMWLH